MLTTRCIDITSQSDVSKKNRLEQLEPSSKVIVARKHSGLEIAKVDPVASWHTLTQNLWRGQRPRTDQWNRSNAGIQMRRLEISRSLLTRDNVSNPRSFPNINCLTFYFVSCLSLFVTSRGKIHESTIAETARTRLSSFDRSLFKLETLLFVDFLRLRRTRVSCWTEPRWVSPTSMLERRKMYLTVISFLAIRHMNVNMRNPRLFPILNENIVVPLRTICFVAES